MTPGGAARGVQVGPGAGEGRSDFSVLSRPPRSSPPAHPPSRSHLSTSPDPARALLCELWGLSCSRRPSLLPCTQAPGPRHPNGPKHQHHLTSPPASTLHHAQPPLLSASQHPFKPTRTCKLQFKNGYAALEEVWPFLKRRNAVITRPGNPAPGGLPTRTENTGPQENLFTKLTAAPYLGGSHPNIQTRVRPHNRLRFSHKKEEV